MNLSRRDLLKFSAGAAVLAGIPLTRLAAADTKQAAPAGKKIPIGLQLWSVRAECKKDLPGTLKAIAAMGYQGVEFAGDYGLKPDALRKLLEDNKLACCGTHTGLPALLGDKWKATIDFNKAIGNKFVIIPNVTPKRLSTEEGIKGFAKQLNELAEKGKAEGIRIGYHAHTDDFKKVGGTTAWEILFANASPDVVMQLDVGHCVGGGGDPYAILAKWADRATTIHVKEHGGKQGATVGEGDVKWDKVFQLCEAAGKTEWYIVEQETYATTPMESVKQCIAYLRKMGK